MEKTLQTNTKVNNYLDSFARVFLGSLLIFLADIKIPFYPISFTAHTLAIFLIALTQRPKIALFSTLLYLGYESLGFSLSYGESTLWFLSNKAGYLVGFPIAAYVISMLSSKISGFMAVTIGQAIIYICGASWLAVSIGLENALYYGILIFIPSAIVKNYLAQFISKWAKKRV